MGMKATTIARRTLGAAAVVLAASSCLAHGDAAAEVETLSVDTALALALEHSRLIDVAELDVERADQTLSASKTWRLPSLDLQVLGGKTLTPIRTTYPEGAFGSF